MIVNVEAELTTIKFTEATDGIAERNLIIEACGEYVYNLAVINSPDPELLDEEIAQVSELVNRIHDGVPEPEIVEVPREGSPLPFGLGSRTVKPGPEVGNIFDVDEIELLDTVLLSFIANTRRVIVRNADQNPKDINNALAIQRGRAAISAKKMVEELHRGIKNDAPSSL